MKNSYWEPKISMKNNDSFSLPPVSQIIFKRSLRNEFLKNTIYFYKYYSMHPQGKGKSPHSESIKSRFKSRARILKKTQFIVSLALIIVA